MALWMRLMLNDCSIGYLEARRRDHRNPPHEDDVCLYDWTVSLNGHDDVRSSVQAAPLAHRYGDGAWALVAKILARAGHLPTELVVEDQWPPMPDPLPGTGIDPDADYTAPLEPLAPLEILDPDACIAAAQRIARRTYLTRREATVARALNHPDTWESP